MKQRLSTLILTLLLIWAWVPLAAGQSPSSSHLTILLSNDDGYDAPGLKALAAALSPIARIVVAAPSTQQSGTGHGITYREPIMVRRIRHDGNFPWYSIAARPATCVRLALEALMSTKPDLVISGINRGENLGLVTFYSGTVAAAREAALTGVPAVAVSMRGNDVDDYSATATYVRRLVKQLQAQKLLRAGTFLNVNVPAGAAQGVKGVRITRLSLKPPKQMYQRRTSPRGQLYFWSIYRPVADDVSGTDVHAFAHGFITITPLSIDQTQTADLEVIRGLAESSPVGGQARPLASQQSTDP